MNPPLPFELTPGDRLADPELRVARPGRLGVALSLVRDAHTTAISDYRGLDAKAGSVVGWIAAVFAIALFQNVGTAQARHPALLIASFLSLVASLLLAIRAQRPDDVAKAGIWEPMDAYDYQSSDLWDNLDPVGSDINQVAQAQTELKLIQFTDRAIKALRAASTAKQRFLYASHIFFALGIALLAASLIAQSLSQG